jgi:hypothetical protein
MRALDDAEDLAVTEAVDLLVGPADVGEDGEACGGLVEEDRIMRGDRLALVVADDGGPGVLADQIADHLAVRHNEGRVVTHPANICFRR